jgi:hypothetical protein
MALSNRTALLIIDVQQGLNAPHLGRRNSCAYGAIHAVRNVVWWRTFVLLKDLCL